MRIGEIEEQIHILEPQSTAMTVLKNIIDSGVQEDAFYVLDVGEIVRQHKEWKMKLPRVEPFYAVKCNDHPILLKVLAALGTGFDCASKGEINKVLDMGVDPHRIIFANPAKMASQIRHAASQGVDLMTFDNECELHKIKTLFPAARLVIRIRADAADPQCPLGMKFGCDADADAPRLLELAKTHGLNVCGVSFHVGSGCQEPAAYMRAIAKARLIFDHAAKIGYNFTILDLGGGYLGNKDSSIDKMAEAINCALDTHFPVCERVMVIAEPGRFYSAAAFTLATNIHSKRNCPSHTMYYINDGVYGSFNCILYDHAKVKPLAYPVGQRALPTKVEKCSIWGPTCDGLDQVMDAALLPPLDIGDWIIFEDMGAYTLPVASTFNGFPLPKVHAVISEPLWLLLKDRLPLSEDNFSMDTTPFWLSSWTQEEEEETTIPSLSSFLYDQLL